VDDGVYFFLWRWVFKSTNQLKIKKPKIKKNPQAGKKNIPNPKVEKKKPNQDEEME
jgi:hypothetical protein